MTVPAVGTAIFKYRKDGRMENCFSTVPVMPPATVSGPAVAGFGADHADTVCKDKPLLPKPKLFRDYFQIYRPVMLVVQARICAGVPVATMRPPSSPPPGPMSIM